MIILLRTLLDISIETTSNRLIQVYRLIMPYLRSHPKKKVHFEGSDSVNSSKRSGSRPRDRSQSSQPADEFADAVEAIAGEENVSPTSRNDRQVRKTVPLSGTTAVAAQPFTTKIELRRIIENTKIVTVGHTMAMSCWRQPGNEVDGVVSTELPEIGIPIRFDRYHIPPLFQELTTICQQ